ncbi:MAG: S8 family serine peptidase [Planctomycetota bacterium]|nr:S8 family serine peptidase [Planctomycetota bacterium]
MSIAPTSSGNRVGSRTRMEASQALALGRRRLMLALMAGFCAGVQVGVASAAPRVGVIGVDESAHPWLGFAPGSTTDVRAMLDAVRAAGVAEVRSYAISAGETAGGGAAAGRVWHWTRDGETFYAISLDGQRVAKAARTSYEVLLEAEKFEPLRDAQRDWGSLASGPEGRVWLMQFHTPMLEEYRLTLAQRGVEVHAHVGNHAVVVRGEREAIAAAAAGLPFVRWSGPLHPAYRLEPVLLEQLLAGEAAGVASNEPAARYSIMVMPWLGTDGPGVGGPAEARAAAGKIAALGGSIDLLLDEGFRMEATLTRAQLARVAAMDEVLFIDRWLPPVSYMDNVREDGGANFVESVAGFTGRGVRGEVLDSGLFNTHGDFARNAPIVRTNSGSTSHGTSVYGIVFGTGAGSGTARGLLPDAQGIFATYTNLGNRRTHTNALTQAPLNAVFQTNSWGSCCFTTYTTQAADIDDILFDNDFTLLQAQANTGNNSSDVIAFAKNLVSVGGIQHRGTLARADDFHSGASGSTGPASDGRTKPDLSYWYDNIRTTATGGGYTNGFGGTSAATPMTAGYFGLMFQMWAEGIFGNPTDGTGNVFANRPKMATAKAIMINSSNAYAFTGENADLRRVRQGWGVASVRNLYNARENTLVVDETEVISNLETHTYRVRVPQNAGALRATLVYTDPAGTPNSARHRVNNLSLRVVNPDGTSYWGNAGLRLGNVTTADGTENLVDTVENVWLAAPSSGVWTVEVRASEIVQDARIETPAVDADYALVVSGLTCTADLNLDGQVDVTDYLDFAQAFSDEGAGADFNADGLVDIFDYLDFAVAFSSCRFS